MKISAISNKGFTLVELAIVLMIIGLLIGGILKGQELIINARMASVASQVKSYTAALISFQDMYNALPGDIANPSTRLPNCSSAMCNTAGNGNGIVGTTFAYSNTENNAFWMHLGASNLISGIDPNSTWVSGGDNFVATAPLPPFAMGGRVQVIHLSTPWSMMTPVPGYYLHSVANVGQAAMVDCKQIERYDYKYDDGKPNTGSVLLHFNHARVAGGNYDPAATGLCTMILGI